MYNIVCSLCIRHYSYLVEINGVDRKNLKRTYQILGERQVSGKNFIKYTQSQNICKPNDLNVSGSTKTKGPKQEGQNWLR